MGRKTRGLRLENNRTRMSIKLLTMLCCYILLLVMFFLLYVGTVIYSDYLLGKDQYEITKAQMSNSAMIVLNSILESADYIANRVNYSLVFRDPYLTLLSGEELSIKDRTLIIQELRSAYAWCGMTDIEEVVLLLDNSDIALSASGIVSLHQSFQHQAYPTQYMEYTSIASLLGTESSRFTFLDDNIIFVTGFRYQGGNDRGVICISYNRERIEKKLKAILGEDNFSLMFAENILAGSDLGNGGYETLSEKENQKLRLKVFFPDYVWAGPNDFASISIAAGFVLFIVIIIIFIHNKKSYSESIRKIRNLIPIREETIGNDEVESIVNDLRGVLQENDKNREKLVEVAGYVEKGFFSSFTSDEKDLALLHNYLGFQRPYYLVMAISVDGEGWLDGVLEAIEEQLSDETISVSYHKRDMQSALIYMNSDFLPDEEEYSEKVYLIAKAYSENNVPVTIGTDVPREDFMDFKKSSSLALSALKKMLVNGKDDIYFALDEEEGRLDYYMVPALDVQVAKCIRNLDVSMVSELFGSLLETNLMKYELTPDSVIAINDELFYTEVKVLRSISLDEDWKAEKPNKYSTIEEVIEFYKNLYIRIIEEIEKRSEDDDDDLGAIAQYVDDHYTDPGLSLKMLSAIFSISTKSIGNYFSFRFHMNYLDYVTKKRIDKAMTLLITTTLGIDEVSLLSGYSSPLTFRRNFKDLTGITPSEYRSRANSSK